MRTCRHCGKEIIKGRSHRDNLFCNSECGRMYRFIQKHEEFKQGKISSRPTLRRHVIFDRGHKCEICNLTEWLGKPIPLVLDHKDGNWKNDFPENLQLVCGNCDMQLPTYKAKNKGKGRPYRRQAPVA